MNKGGDAACSMELIPPSGSNAAPTFNPKGCGIPEWSGRYDDPYYYTDEQGQKRWKSGLGKLRPDGYPYRDPRKWAEVALDFLKSGNFVDAQISLQTCIDSLL